MPSRIMVEPTDGGVDVSIATLSGYRHQIALSCAEAAALACALQDASSTAASGGRREPAPDGGRATVPDPS